MTNPIVDAAGRVVYAPWVGPQETFWDFKGRYGLYGGSGFTGKTDLLRWYPWQQIQAEDARLKAGEHMEQSTGHALVLRRETPQLRELMARCRADFERTNPDINWIAGDKTWEFPNGYRYTVGHMENEEDWMKYQGWQISFLGLDEGTTFTEKQFSMIDAWVRQPKNSYLTPIIRMGSNPVGVGKKWVRKFFVLAGYSKSECPKYWGKPVVKELDVPVVDDMGRKTTEKRLVERLFVPARVSDNKSVDQGDYAATLVDKPEYIRKAIFEGDWWAISEEAWAGKILDEEVHFIKPFKVPPGWFKFRSGKFGNVWPAMSSIQWWAVDPLDNMTCYRSLTVTGVNAEELAQTIRSIEIENGEWNVHSDCSKLSGPLNDECWPQTDKSGPTIEESFRNAGVFWRRGSKDWQQAAEQMRIRLQRRTPHPTNRTKDGKPRQIPGIRWFETCQNALKTPDGEKIDVGPVATLPELQKDEKKPDIWIRNGFEHDIESAALAAMSRPITGKETLSADEDEVEEARANARRGSNPYSPGGYWT
jgi:hypothetical protein